MSLSAKMIAGWVGFALNVLIGIYLIFGAFLVYPRRRITIWSARHFRPMLANIYWSILFVLIERNLQLFGGVLGYFNIGFAGGWIISNIFSLTFFALYLKRAWLLHFDYNAGLALFIQKTNLQVASDFEVHFRWFLENKGHYGSPRYLYRFTIAVCVILNLILIGWVEVSQDSFEYGLVAIYCLLMIIAMGTTKKITHMEDNFFIREEILWQFRTLALYFFIAGGLIIFAPAMGFEWCKFFLVEFSCICVGIMGYFATYWVKYQATKYALEKPNSQLYDLELIFTSNDNCALFLKHLVREMSVENMFFLADVMAYKKAFLDHRKLFRQIPGFTCKVPLQLSRYKYLKDRTFVHYSWSISKIYIDGSSIFYVTSISDETRKSILDFVENLSPFMEGDNEDKVDYEKLCTIFDEACNEVYGVLKGAYSRFTKTSEFNNVVIEKISVEMTEVASQQQQNILPTRSP